MINQKRAQAAMEFLMTYGWAILVVLAAIGALAYFGVLSPSRFLPNRCDVGAGFSCTQFKVSTADNVQLDIQNNMGQDLAEANVTITDSGGTECFPEGSSGTYNSSGTVDNGDSIGGGLVTVDCTTGVSDPLQEGDRYQADLEIVYRISGQTVTHTVNGQLISEVEQ